MAPTVREKMVMEATVAAKQSELLSVQLTREATGPRTPVVSSAASAVVTDGFGYGVVAQARQMK